MSIHPKDQFEIERIYGLAKADIGERMIKLQDDSYELGLDRGLQHNERLISAAHDLMKALKPTGDRVPSHLFFADMQAALGPVLRPDTPPKVLPRVWEWQQQVTTGTKVPGDVPFGCRFHRETRRALIWLSVLCIALDAAVALVIWAPR